MEEKLIKCGQLLSFEEWLKFNEIIFTTVETKKTAEEYYNEYKQEIIKNFSKNS